MTQKLFALKADITALSVDARVTFALLDAGALAFYEAELVRLAGT